MEYKKINFNMQTGIMVINLNGYEISFDVPIADNKYLIGTDLDVFINGVVLNSRKARIDELSAVTNAQEILDLLKTQQTPQTPENIKQTALITLLSFTKFVLDNKAVELGFDSIAQAISFIGDTTGPFYLKAKSLAKWQSTVWTNYLTAKESILSNNEFNIEVYRSSIPTFALLDA